MSHESSYNQSSANEGNRESFYGRFSTSKGTRESFHGRFSTSKGAQEAILGHEWGYRQLLMMLVVAFDLVFGFVQPFIVEPVRVPSASMAPTLQVGDHTLTNKFVYDFSDPQRGDLVVFDSVEAENGERVVKRVVGLPGDEISVEQGTLWIDGEPQNEPYLAPQENATARSLPGVDSYGPLIVPRNHVFVMGDNRANSYDSRFFGPVPEENLVGEISVRFWPPGRLGNP